MRKDANRLLITLKTNCRGHNDGLVKNQTPCNKHLNH